MADLTQADKDSLKLMPTGWFKPEDLHHTIRRPDYRCRRPMQMGLLEHKLVREADDLYWVYRKKDSI